MNQKPLEDNIGDIDIAFVMCIYHTCVIPNKEIITYNDNNTQIY